MTTFRVITPEEFHQVAEVYARVFTGPLPDNGMFVIAEDGGEIVGFAALQQIWHAEPFWVAPSHRDRGVFTSLIRRVFNLSEDKKGVLISTTNPKLYSILNHLDLEFLKDLKVFRWIRR